MIKHALVEEIERDLFKDAFDIYKEEASEMMLEDDELTPEEAAFMQGYDEAG